jgi:hypothetical protein
MQHQIPVIYFLGTSPGRYQPIIPTCIWAGTLSAYGSSLLLEPFWVPRL